MDYYFVDKLSYQFVEEENYLEVTVIAISANCIKRSYGDLCFSAEVLQKYAKDLVGKPVLLDHKNEVSKR